MYIEDVQAMSNDKLRLKVAEWCGITGITTETEWHDQGGHTDHLIYFTKEMLSFAGIPDKFPTDIQHDVPNYIEDLNAMHKAIMDASKNSIYFTMNYDANLQIVVLGTNNTEERIQTSKTAKFKVINATARQRAEAFVLTMENGKTT